MRLILTPLEFASKHNGIFSAAQAHKAGILHARLSESLKRGELERVMRGIYCAAGTWPDEYAAACLRFPKGVLSHNTALHLHNLTDRTPDRVTMTFPWTYNASAARAEGVDVRSCAQEVMDLGASTVETPMGNTVRAFNVERTLCDLFRGRATIDLQVTIPALKTYLSSPAPDINKLLRYASQLNVLTKLRPYLEALS